MRALEMKPHGERGMLITFCGLDGCGKTTMLTRLRRELEGDGGVFVTKQPTNAVRTSEIFRTYMDKPDHTAYDYRSQSLLAASDRIQHVTHTVLPHLQTGETVLCDRYFYSCLANLRARGYRRDRWIYEASSFVLRPDLAFFFDVPVETAVSRVRAREEERDRYIDMELQYRLRREYRDICRANRGILISTERSEDECFAEILDAVTRLKKKKERMEKKHD